MLSESERRAIRRHAAVIDQHESDLARERARLSEPTRQRMSDLFEISNKAVGPADGQGVFQCRGYTFEEEKEVYANHLRIEAGIGAYDRAHRPKIEPWETPAKIAAWISEKEEQWDARRRLVWNHYTSGSQLSDREKRQIEENDARDAYREARRRLLTLIHLAPSLRRDFGEASDPIIGLQDIRAWCEQAAGPESADERGNASNSEPGKDAAGRAAAGDEVRNEAAGTALKLSEQAAECLQLVQDHWTADNQWKLKKQFVAHKHPRNNGGDVVAWERENRDIKELGDRCHELRAKMRPLAQVLMTAAEEPGIDLPSTPLREFLTLMSDAGIMRQEANVVALDFLERLRLKLVYREKEPSGAPRGDSEEHLPGPRAAGEPPPRPTPTHSGDFVFVNWFGVEYVFALGIQSSAVKALWEEWEKTGLGLHQETICNAIDAERENFRMDITFRNHPAFATMIKPCGKGRYRLAPPIATPGAPNRRAKNSDKRTPKSRRAHG